MTPDNWITVGALLVAVITSLATLISISMQSRRERDRIRFQFVYEERFRVCRELYTRLAQLRSKVEDYTHFTLDDKGRKDLEKELHKRIDAFHISLWQNDVIFDDAFIDQLDQIWTEFKSRMHAWTDSLKEKGESSQEARKALLGHLDHSRTALRPEIRRIYGSAGKRRGVI